MYTFVNISPFTEHLIVDIAQFDAGEFDITIFEDKQPSNFINKGSFYRELYCKCLLNKLFTLPKSKVKPFIQYQCERMNEPIIWLNKFEKLIDVNRDLFTTKDQIIRFEKALVVIELMRESIEQESRKPSVYKQFNFNDLKNKVKQYRSYEEKISCLMEAQADYLQNKPKLIDPSETPFDEKIDIEINKLERLDQLNLKTLKHEPALKNKLTNNKIVIRGHINVLVDAFYQLLHEKKANGLPYLDVTTPELINLIITNFSDKDGQPLSESTIRTMLSPNRPEKRPKSNNRINL